MAAVRTPGSTILLLHGSNRETVIGTPTVHSSLSGLSSDDHPQYLRTDGSRPLTGDLDIGGNNIVNVAAIGTGSTASGANSIALGNAVSSTSAASVAIGTSLTNAVGSSFKIGNGTGTSQWIAGTPASTITNAHIGQIGVSTLGSGSTTLTTSQLVPDGIIIKSVTGAGDALTLPTVASLIATHSHIRDGDGFRFTIKNNGANAVSLATNTGITFSSGISSTVATTSTLNYTLVITSVGGSTATLYSL